MKSTFALLAMTMMLATAACSSKPARQEAPPQDVSVGTIDDSTVSGAPSSLGAASSGRGH